MLIVPACVAIQIIGAPAATGGEVASLQDRCSEILGGQRCRVVAPADTAPMSAGAASACWRATVSVTERGAAAQVVLRAGADPTAHQSRRDLAFQERDEIGERWATLGLVIAALVTIEERARAGAEIPPAPAPAPTPSPTSSPTSSPIFATTVAVPAARIPARRAWRGPDAHAALAGIAATGPLPGTAFGARLEAGIDSTHLGALARFAYYPERRQTIPVTAGQGGGAFGLWSVGLGGCGRARVGHALGLRACVGGDLTSTTARGFGVADTAVARTLTTTLWGGLGLQLQLARRIAATIDPELLLAVQRTAFAIRGAGTAFTPSRLGGSVALGLAVAF